MRLEDYFVGQAIVLRSPLPREEVRRRVNAAAGSMYWPFYFDRVVGGAQFGFLRLGFKSSPVEYNAKPILSGRLHDHLGGTEIRGRFGAPAWAKLFYFWWYLSFVTVVLPIALAPSSSASGPEWVRWLVPSFLAAAPLAMHFAFTRNSDEELERIVAFLQDEVQATSA